MNNYSEEFGLFAGIGGGLEDIYDPAIEKLRVELEVELERIAALVNNRRSEIRSAVPVGPDGLVYEDIAIKRLMAHYYMYGDGEPEKKSDGTPPINTDNPEEVREAFNDLSEAAKTKLKEQYFGIKKTKFPTEDEKTKFLYGSVPKDRKQVRIEDIPKFTYGDARLLVNEVAGELRLSSEQHIAVARLLYSNLAVDEGDVVKEIDAYLWPRLSGVDQFNNIMTNVMSARSKELMNDPRTLLMANKMKVAIEAAVDADVFDYAQAQKFLPGYQGEITDQESEAITEWLASAERNIKGSVEDGIKGWAQEAAEEEKDFYSYLLGAMERNMGSTPDTLRENNELSVEFGREEEVPRRTFGADLELLGQGNSNQIKKLIEEFSKRIDTRHSSLFEGFSLHLPGQIKSNTLPMGGNPIRAAIAEVNEFVKSEIATYIGELGDRDPSMTNYEKGERVLRDLEALFSPVTEGGTGELEAGMPGDSHYVRRIREKVDEALKLQVGTLKGLKGYLQWHMPGFGEFSTQVQEQIIDNAWALSRNPSDIDILVEKNYERWAEESRMQLAREKGEAYSKTQANTDLRNWLGNRNILESHIDPDELKKWEELTHHFRGMDGLLTWQERRMRAKHEQDYESFSIGLDPRLGAAVSPVEIGPQDVAEALKDNILSGSAAAIQQDIFDERASFDANDAEDALEAALFQLSGKPDDYIEELKPYFFDYLPEIGRAGGLTPGITASMAHKIASVQRDLDAVISARDDSQATNALKTNFNNFAFNVAQDLGVINEDTSQDFLSRFSRITIPRLRREIFDVRGMSTPEDIYNLVAGSLAPGQPVQEGVTNIDVEGGWRYSAPDVYGENIGLPSINIDPEAWREFKFDPVPGTPGASLTPDERIKYHDMWVSAKELGLGINALGELAPFTPGQKAMGQDSQSLNEVMGSIEVQRGVGIPMFPTGEGIPAFEQISPADMRAGMARSRQARIEEEGISDVEGARAELERLQAGGAALEIEIPEVSGYDERGRPVFEGLEVGSGDDRFIRGLMDRSRRDRMRQEEDRAYRREIQRQVPVGAGEFAGVIQQVAGEDVGFQRYLLGQSEAVRRRFEKAGGRTAKAPKDFSEYFVGEELPELSRKYTESPGAIASELGRMETERRETKREEEDVRRRSLRRGRTIARI